MNFAIDLDGTIAEWADDHKVCGEWLPGAKEAIETLLDEGHAITIHTCRATWTDSDGADGVARFLLKGGFRPFLDYGINEKEHAPGHHPPQLSLVLSDEVVQEIIEFDEQRSSPSAPLRIVGMWVGQGKPVAHVYVDDRAYSFSNWATDLPALLSITKSIPSLPEDAPTLHFEKDWNWERESPGYLSTYTRKPLQVQARQMEVAFTCKTIDGNVAAGKAGDYLVLDAKGFPYPCQREIFEGTHEKS